MDGQSCQRYRRHHHLYLYRAVPTGKLEAEMKMK